jgi:chaperone required for assembly of F1-ATPase
MRTPAPKRFYRHAETAERNGGFVLLLDGRPARTPARRELSVPTRALGEALAGEWQAQGAELDPGTMPLTRLVNSAIDGVADRREAVVDDLVRYAGSDLLCYRAGEPERLVAAQGAAWDPVLAWAREALGARFHLGEGVMHVQQPAEAVAAVREALGRVPVALRARGAARHDDADRLRPARPRPTPRARWTRMPPGRRRTWTSATRKAFGGRTRRRWSGGRGAKRSSARRPTFTA